MSTNNNVALITGAGRGIGRSIALRLARDGFAVSLLDVDRVSADGVADEVRALGQRVVVVVGDIADRDTVHAAVDKTEQVLGGFDVMVNNAGIAQVQPISKVTPKDVERMLNINIVGVLWGIQAAAMKFIERKQKGKIINAASVAGHEGSPMMPVYCATKFAVRGLTQSAAREYAGAGITVNSYCPGVVDTRMWEGIDRQVAELTGSMLGATYHEYAQRIALGRLQTPDDVANLVAFMASGDSDYITGQSLITDGGLVFR